MLSTPSFARMKISLPAWYVETASVMPSPSSSSGKLAVCSLLKSMAGMTIGRSGSYGAGWQIAQRHRRPAGDRLGGGEKRRESPASLRRHFSAAGGVRVWRELGERRVELHVPAPAGELAQLLRDALGIGAHVFVGNRAPRVGRQPHEVVEDLRVGVDPLAGGDLGERLAGEGAPVFEQEQRPLFLPRPVGQVGIGDELLRAPRVEDRADVSARLAVEKMKRAPGNAAARKGMRSAFFGVFSSIRTPPRELRDEPAVAVAELAEKRVLQFAHRVRIGVGFGEAVRVVTARDAGRALAGSR